jgi:hypothetical protein
MFVHPVFESFTVETSSFETFPVVPVEIRAIVFIVDPVAEVTVPDGVVVISIPRELTFIYNGRRSLIIFVLAYRSGRILFLVNYGRRRGRCNIHPARGNIEPDVDGYLRVSGSGNQGTGEDRGKYK